MLSGFELGLAETAVESLAKILAVSEAEVVEILREGMEMRNDPPGKLNELQEFLISELENEFGHF